MNLPGFCALLSAWLLGGLIVVTFWSRHRTWRSGLGLVLPLGFIVGLGATSVIFFFASLLSNRPAAMAGVVELALAGGLAWKLSRRPTTAAMAPQCAPMTWLDWTLATILVQVAVVAAVVAWRSYCAEPYGGWDGWAIWNMQARFMLRAGTAWPELQAAPQLSWTHADYPRLVPASIARAWTWAGGESPAVPALISVLFAAATFALLVAVVARIRGRTIALVTGLLLLGTPFFVTFASNEHADIPLASFLLAAVALALLAEREAASAGTWVLAGLCAGLAAWTKNEGLLFAIVFATVIIVRARQRGARSAMAFLLLGLGAALVPVAVFKLFIAPTNDLLAAPLGPRLAQLVDASRHRLILASIWRDLGRFGEWHVAPFLVMAVPFVGWRWRRSAEGPNAGEPPALPGGIRILPLVVLAMLMGFYGVYLLSPHDLAWHLDTSLVRLLLQLWPPALLWWGMSIPWGEPASAVGGRQTITRVVFVLANAVAAMGIVTVLSGQRATNELAVVRQGFSTVSAIPGEGWFNVERHGAATWVWSRGNATLELHARTTRSAKPITLRFALRSLAPRTVVIRSGERILWQGALGANFMPVEIPALGLPTGTTSLDLTTDAPGVPESSAPGARSLAFALYDVRLE